MYFLLFFSKLLKVLPKVTIVTTEHQKLPKMEKKKKQQKKALFLARMARINF